MRYAVYFTPPADDPLSIAAARWLGRDAFRNLVVTQSAIEGFDAVEIMTLTEEPRRYGFHATLKAPFGLSADRTENDLVESFEAFAAKVDAFEMELKLGQLGAFFALVPVDRNEKLHAFADACVRDFEPFRAGLSAADMARRKPERLTIGEREHLKKWGYPYVFDDFRFHMTLTGPVPIERQPAMNTALSEIFAPFIARPIAVAHLGLFVEPERGAPFVMKRIAPLRPLPERKLA